MRPRRVKELIENALDAQWAAKGDSKLMPQPIFLHGAPGIGKSACPRGVAKEMEIGYVDDRPPLRDPTDYRGIPTVLGDTAMWLAPSDLPTNYYCLGCGSVLHKHQMVVSQDAKIDIGTGRWTGVQCKICGSFKITSRGIMIMDELPSAPPMTQAACYQLVLDHQIGEYKFPTGWYLIAAGNRIEDRAVAYRVSTALNNRFTHIDYDVNIDDWIDWALNEGQIDPNIIGFLKFRGGDLLWNFKPESSDLAFPTPRTWEFASKAIGFIRKRDILAETLEGTIGKGATAEFISFLKVQTELPDLGPILNGTGKYIPPNNRTDLKYAIVSALVTRAQPKQHYDNLIKYSGNLPEEFSVLLVTMMVSKDKQTVATCPTFPQWARDHKDVILTKKV